MQGIESLRRYAVVIAVVIATGWPTTPTAAQESTRTEPSTTEAPAVATAPVAPPTPLPAALAARPAPLDLASFPRRPSANTAQPARGIELHGFVATWATPVTGPAPSAQTDAFRIRFAVLRVDARPTSKVTILTRLAPMVPGSPLLDAAITYTPHDAIGVTAGQFRLPIGAAATTLAPQIVMLDRPSYAYAMSMIAFRDVGVMVHSGPRGLADGLVHYRVAVANGTGRLGSGLTRPPESPEDALYVARVVFEPSRLLFDDAESRLAIGGTYARVRSAAIATGDAARDRALAANVLGRTLVAYDAERTTQLAGADVTLEHRGLHAQAELTYLHSDPEGAAAAREALGASLELAYTLPMRIADTVDVRFATRYERFDPAFRNDDDEQDIVQFGVTAMAGALSGSAFGTVTSFHDGASGARRAAGEITFRAAAAF